MVKVIRLSRYVFEGNHIQHNVTFSVSSIFDKEEDMMNARIHILFTLLESLFPNTIKIVSLIRNAHPLSEQERVIKGLNLLSRSVSYNEGDEISLNQLRDLMIYCYGEGIELELDILDIKNQHVTAVVNKDVFRYHYIYGSPETFTEEYLATIKKKLKDCAFDGSFKKTL